MTDIERARMIATSTDPSFVRRQIGSAGLGHAEVEGEVVTGRLFTAILLAVVTLALFGVFVAIGSI